MYLQWCKVDYTTDHLHHTPHNQKNDAASTSSDSSSSNSDSNSCLTDSTDITNSCSTGQGSVAPSTSTTDAPHGPRSAYIQYDTMHVIDVDTALSSACETIWYGNIGR